MSHSPPASTFMPPAIRLDCEPYYHYLDDQRRGGFRQIAIPVVITNEAKRDVLIRASFNGTPGLTIILHPKQVLEPTDLYAHAMELKLTALHTQSVRVVVATEPVGVRCGSDGVLTVVLEMFDQLTGLCVTHSRCGSIFSPVALNAWYRQYGHLVPRDLHTTEPAFAPPELLPSSSSSASSVESSSPIEPRMTSFPPSPGPRVATLPPKAEAASPTLSKAEASDRVMRFTRSTHVPARATAHAAELEILDDLDKLTQDWTLEELAAKRRLVRFECQRQNSLLKISACALRQVDWEESTSEGVVIISCILDEACDEHVATSVDILHLIERMLFNEHTIDERNRIRRNIEGLQPRAIAKGQKDVDALFSLVMNFPNPKPRSIEKSLKVFRWSSIPEALEKIVAKYSAVEIEPVPSTSTRRQFKAQRRKDSSTAPYAPRSPRKFTSQRAVTRPTTRRSQPIIKTASASPEPQTPVKLEPEQSHGIFYDNHAPTFNMHVFDDITPAKFIPPAHHPAQVLVHSDPNDGRRRIPSLQLPAFTQDMNSPPMMKSEVPSSRLSSLNFGSSERGRISSTDFLAQASSAATHAHQHALEFDLDGTINADQHPYDSYLFNPLDSSPMPFSFSFSHAASENGRAPPWSSESSGEENSTAWDSAGSSLPSWPPNLTTYAT